MSLQNLPKGTALSRGLEGSLGSPLLHFDDLARLSPDNLGRVCEWLTEKVDSLCAQLKPDSKVILETKRRFPWYPS